MRRRYTLSADGTQFVDSNGRPMPAAAPLLGRVVALTVDLPAGGVGGGSPSTTSKGNSNDRESSNVGLGKGGLEGNPKAESVWAAYVAIMQPRHTEVTPEEATIIADALRVASAEECIRAIEGCANSSFHMGENEKRRKYNNLSGILRGRKGKETTRERIDFFIDLAGDHAGGQEVTSEEKFKIETLKDRVRRGNGNGDGDRAERELCERYGIETVWEDTRRARAGRIDIVRSPQFVQQRSPLGGATR